MSKLGSMKNYLQFILALISITAILLVGWYIEVDISNSVVAIFGIYVTGRSLVFGSAAVSSSKDPGADTRSVLQDHKEQ